jgi:hypothetical protein
MACVLLLSCLPLLQAAVAPSTYFVDSTAGDDANSGRSPAGAWRTLAPVRETAFGPGDCLLLRAGGAFDAPLDLHGSGTPEQPIRVGPYGEGPPPKVTAGPGGGPLVSLVNSECWEVADLELEGGSCGVFAYAKEFGVARHLWFQRLRIHDVRGGGDDGGFLLKREGEDTWFDDLLIEDCTIERADRNGILLTDYPTVSDKHHSTRVVIRGNRLRDIGGDGIFVLGCDGAVIERNVLRYAHQRVGRGPGERACAGIWPQRSNDTLIQFNEVSHTAVGGLTVWDSEAFDDDIGCRGTVFQCNYSHDNAGGFLLVCGGARGTVARYNISQNDATATFTIESDGSGDVTLHNNTIYVGEGMDVGFVRNTSGAPDGLRVVNNILYAAGSLRHHLGGIRNATFAHNAYYGTHVSLPADEGAVLTDPMLAAPGSAADGWDTLAGYRLLPGSPCVGAGESLEGSRGLRDFWGHALADGQPLCIGAGGG